MAKKNNITKNNSIWDNSKLIVVVILTITASVFFGVKNCDFLTNWDDDGYIIQNTHIYKINAENISNIFTSYYKSNYQPLSVLTYAIEFEIGRAHV